MGIYTNYTGVVTESAHDWASEIPANEAYGAALGCAQIIADCQVNDMALFESTIYNDFNEVFSLREGVDYVNENAFTDVIKKIVEMFKKLLAKIKGIFSAFLAKLTGAFMDGKKLVKKYENQIIKYGNWKEFKCKIDKPRSSHINIINSINGIFKYDEKSAGVNTNLYALKITIDSVLPNEFNTVFSCGTNADAIDKVNDMDSDDIKNKLLKHYVTVSAEISDLHENIHEELYDEKEEINGDDDKVTGSYFSAAWIKGVLNDDKWEKNVKKFNERLDKNINTIIDNLEKTATGLAEWRGKNGTDTDIYNKSNRTFARADANGKIQKVSGEKDWTNADSGKKSFQSSENVQKAISCLQKIASKDQEVITQVTSEYMTQVKFAIGQARKVWTAAAAWSSGVHKESVEYTQAVAESAMEQFYVNMEAIH